MEGERLRIGSPDRRAGPHGRAGPDRATASAVLYARGEKIRTIIRGSSAAGPLKSSRAPRPRDKGRGAFSTRPRNGPPQGRGRTTTCPQADPTRRPSLTAADAFRSRGGFIAQSARVVTPTLHLRPLAARPHTAAIRRARLRPRGRTRSAAIGPG